MIVGYSAFFYHYADFPAPWLALSLGGAAGALAGHRRWSLVLVRVFAVVIVLVAVVQIREMYPTRHSGAEAVAHEIPPGACVVTDEVSLSIAADRFANLPPGCPDIIDSLADTLVLSNGVSVQGGAQNMPAVVAQWQTWFSKADYVWLSPDQRLQAAHPVDDGPVRLVQRELRQDRRQLPGHRPALPAPQLHPSSRLRHRGLAADPGSAHGQDPRPTPRAGQGQGQSQDPTQTPGLAAGQISAGGSSGRRRKFS